jgi:hypothetical protein
MRRSYRCRRVTPSSLADSALCQVHVVSGLLALIDSEACDRAAHNKGRCRELPTYTGRNSELKRAYSEHANTRSSLSMLYCAGAILDAMWHGQSLKALGMDLKLVHQDARLYLISQASLHNRGFAPGMASVIQVLVAQEHRLVIPFSLKNLQCTLAPWRGSACLGHTTHETSH